MPTIRVVDDNVIEFVDSNGDVAAREGYDEAASEVSFVDGDGNPMPVSLGDATAESLNIDDGSINGLAFGRGFDQDTVGDVTSRNIDKLSIAGDSYGTIFSVASPVDVIGGSAFGQGGDHWRITWEDDTTDELSVGLGRSQLDDEDVMVTPLPSVEGVKKLELFNQFGGSRSYGAVVLTT